MKTLLISLLTMSTLSASAFAQNNMNPDWISRVLEAGSYVGDCKINSVKSINQQTSPAGTYYSDTLAQISQDGNKTQVLFQNGTLVRSDKTTRGTYVLKNTQHAFVEGIKYTQVTKIEIDPEMRNEVVALTVDSYAMINGKKIVNKSAAVKCVL